MAFIRWKKNKFDVPKAYLVQSYRDDQGRPRQKILAFLGKSGELKPEHLESCKARYSSLPIALEKLSPGAAAPARRNDVSGLSDMDLAYRLRELRRERGISILEMVESLQGAGLLEFRGPSGPETMNRRTYLWLERAFAGQSPQPYYRDIATQLAPYVRKVL